MSSTTERPSEPDPVTWEELYPVVLGSMPRGADELVARNIAVGVAMHLEFRTKTKA